MSASYVSNHVCKYKVLIENRNINTPANGGEEVNTQMWYGRAKSFLSCMPANDFYKGVWKCVSTSFGNVQQGTKTSMKSWQRCLGGVGSWCWDTVWSCWALFWNAAQLLPRTQTISAGMWSNPTAHAWLLGYQVVGLVAGALDPWGDGAR